MSCNGSVITASAPRMPLNCSSNRWSISPPMVHSSARGAPAPPPPKGNAVRLRLDYGTDGLDVDLPDERATVIEPMTRPAVADAHSPLLEPIRAPLGRAPLRQLVRPGQKIAISVCDITRAQPRQEMLRAIVEDNPGVQREGLTIL